MVIYRIESFSQAPSDGPYAGLNIATGVVVVAATDIQEALGRKIQVVDHAGCLRAADIGAKSQAWWGVTLSLAPGAKPKELTPNHWLAMPRGNKRRVSNAV